MTVMHILQNIHDYNAYPNKYSWL